MPEIAVSRKLLSSRAKRGICFLLLWKYPSVLQHHKMQMATAHANASFRAFCGATLRESAFEERGRFISYAALEAGRRNRPRSYRPKFQAGGTSKCHPCRPELQNKC